MDPNMSQRTPHHDRLDAFAGEWKTREVHAPSPWLPQGGTGEGRSSIRWGLGRLALIHDYKSKGAMGPEFEGHGVETWDPNRGKYVFTWFDSMAPVGRPSFGHVEGNDIIYFMESENPQTKEKMTFRTVVHGVSKDEWTFSMSADQAGKWVPMMTITYVRA